jgi:hypothetical protein
MLRPFDTRAKSFFRGLKAFGVPLLLAVVSASFAQETPDEKHQESASPPSIQRIRSHKMGVPLIASAYLESSGLLVLQTTRMLLPSRREASSGYSFKM